jgi:hypothetical protein
VIETAELVERIWQRDPSIWTGRDEAQWLGWLDEPARMRERVDELEAFAASADVDDVVLLGMGGSSLAPEVMRRLFAAERFHVLDTTHPAAVRRLEESVDVERTLFLAASKSGTTIETRSHVDYFHARGARFAVITDPGSPLAELADDVFYGEPTIGGRYSALSVFGLLPAVVMGIDVHRLLDRAEEMREACQLEEGNPGLELGLELARTPFFRWEFATAVAGAVLGVNPFDQPDVQSAKDRTNALLSETRPVPGTGPGPEGNIDALLAQARPGEYVAILAFVDPAREAELEPIVQRAKETGAAVAVGLGPRYLHSTGQLHKGGPDVGLFVQVVDDFGPDEFEIPGRPYGFRTLIAAQAAGDFQALNERGRRIVRVGL